MTKLYSGSIPDKKLWLQEVCLARKEYVEPDNEVTWQSIAQRKVMQTFLSIDNPLEPTTPRDRPAATQDNHVTEEAQVVADARFFGRPKEKRPRLSSIVITTANILQQKLPVYHNIC